MAAPEGLLLVDKPGGMTSHDVVDRVRRSLGTRKVGHAGTLDPMATGLLVVGVGRATRLLRYLSGLDKDYEGVGRLGEMWPGSDVADVLCVGKALGGGLPLSAALFLRPELEQKWDFGDEDLYTHTHSGNPLACAAALVVLEEVPKLLPRIAELSDRFEAAGWEGRGLLRVTTADWSETLSRGVNRMHARTRVDPDP